jgi:hypothetical protein
MFSGKYKVYLDGQLVAEKENSITRSGRQIILKNLMGAIRIAGGSIHMGVGSTANGSSNLSSASTSSGVVTYTTPQNHQYRVGDIISVTGNSVAAYNVSNATITLVPTTTTFRISSAGSSSTGTGGVVQLVKPLDGLIPNTRLDFATSAVPITLSFLDNAGDFDAIVFKGAIAASGDGAEAQKIYELGIFPPTTSSLSFNQTLFNGSSVDGWMLGDGPGFLSLNTGSTLNQIGTSCYITPALTSFPFRVGDNALFIKNGQRVRSVGSSSSYSNLATYGTEDFISLAISKIPANTPTIRVRFYRNSNVYWTLTYTTNANQGYQVLNKSFSEAVPTSSGGVAPSWSEIRYVEISVLDTSPGDVVIDAVRINDNIEIDPTYGMISRTVLDTPIIKNTAQSLEIEYYLSLTFNKTVT